MTDLERLSLTLGITDEELLRSLLEDAEADVLREFSCGNLHE